MNILSTQSLLLGSGLVTITGNVIYVNGIATSGGATGSFVLTSQTGNFITTGQTGAFGGGTNINLSTLVSTSGNQIISGIKTFATGIDIAGIVGISVDPNLPLVVVSGLNNQTGNMQTWYNFTNDQIGNIDSNGNFQGKGFNLNSNFQPISSIAAQIGLDNLNNLIFSDGVVGQFTLAQTIQWRAKSGQWITTGQTGTFGGSTGSLTGAFYPLINNPANYVTSTQTGLFSGNFYPLRGNPSGFVTNVQTGLFYAASNPNGFINSGSLAPLFTNSPVNSGFVLWTVSPNIAEERRIMHLTGNTILQISGLYNGWAALLETIQSGTASGTFSLSASGYLSGQTTGFLPKVINSGAGSLPISRVSGNIDIFGLICDGTNLFISCGNSFS